MPEVEETAEEIGTEKRKDCEGKDDFDVLGRRDGDDDEGEKVGKEEADEGVDGGFEEGLESFLPESLFCD